jgi:hypothetical protein
MGRPVDFYLTFAQVNACQHQPTGVNTCQCQYDMSVILANIRHNWQQPSHFHYHIILFTGEIAE